ncbi:MAG: hypothetical protein Q8R47_02165 [Nanoarchaeota archaeon]|nr:hypothetical protein [Nanoarchaeota archaeon]
MVPLASAAIINVPGDYGNIQTAINNANSGDVINCNSDQGDGNLNINISVTINGTNVCTADSLIINAKHVTIKNLILNGDYNFGTGSKDSAAIYINTSGNTSTLQNLNITAITAGVGDSTNLAGGNAYGVYDSSGGNHTFENLTFATITAGAGFTTTAGNTGDGGHGGNAWLMSFSSSNMMLKNITFGSVISGDGGDCTAATNQACRGGDGGYGYLIQGFSNVTLNGLTQRGVHAVLTGDAGNAGKTGSPGYCGLSGDVKTPRGLYFSGNIYNVNIHNGTSGAKGTVVCDNAGDDGDDGIDGDIVNGNFNQVVNVAIYNWRGAPGSNGAVHGTGSFGDGGWGADMQVVMHSEGTNPMFKNINLYNLYGGAGANGAVGTGVGGYGGDAGSIDVFIGSNSNDVLENITIHDIETGVGGSSASGSGCRPAGSSGDHHGEYRGKLYDIKVHDIKAPDGSDTQGWGGDVGEVFTIFNGFDDSNNIEVYDLIGGKGGDATCSASGCQDGAGGIVNVRFPVNLNYRLKDFYVHDIVGGDDGDNDCNCADEPFHCGLAAGWNTRPVLPNETEVQYFSNYVNGTIENVTSNRGEWHGVYYQDNSGTGINERGFWAAYVSPVLETNIEIPGKYNITWLTNSEMPSGNNFNLYWGTGESNITNLIVSDTKANLCGTPTAVNCYYEWNISGLEVPNDYWINITAGGWSAAVIEATPQVSLFPLRLGNITTFPENITIDSGDSGNIDYEFNGVLNSSPQEIDLNITEINDYLFACTKDEEGYCLVPVTFHSDTAGILEYSGINITYYETGALNQSKIKNYGDYASLFYLLMKVQYYNTVSQEWIDEAVIVNETISRTLIPGEELRLDQIWNNYSWNITTSSHGSGKYRVYAATNNINGDVLTTSSDISVISTYNFIVGLQGSTENGTLIYSNPQEFPTDPTINISGINYVFNITWTNSSKIDTVILEFNGVNYTNLSQNGNIYGKALTGLAVGEYNYTWYANDTSGSESRTFFQSYTVDEATPLFNIKNTSGSVIAWFGDLGHLVLKNTLQQNSNYQSTSNDLFIIKNNGEEVLIVVNNGSIYIDGTLHEDQETLSSSESSNDFRIKHNGDLVAYVNESGHVFLKRTLIENGIN